jgi:hypothetical protein
MTKHLVLALALASIFATGCKKKTHYSSDCSRAVDLVPPWTELGLPLGDDIRVCSANDLKVELEYLTGDKPGWEKKYEEIMTAKGYVKESCSSVSCKYSRGGAKGEKINVYVNQVATGKRAKTHINLTRTPAKDGAGGSAAAAPVEK